MSSTDEYEQQRYWNYDPKEMKIAYDIVYLQIEKLFLEEADKLGVILIKKDNEK